jgi:hypothetical protein
MAPAEGSTALPARISRWLPCNLLLKVVRSAAAAAAVFPSLASN